MFPHLLLFSLVICAYKSHVPYYVLASLSACFLQIVSITEATKSTFIQFGIRCIPGSQYNSQNVIGTHQLLAELTHTSRGEDAPKTHW